MQKLLSMSDDEINKATGEIRSLIRKLNEFQEKSGIDLKSDSIRPAIGKYDEVQLRKIDNTISNEERSLANKDIELREQALIERFNSDIKEISEQLDAKYIALIEQLLQEFARFKSVLDLAFDIDVNVAFAGSAVLAQCIGCTNDKILWSKQEVDNYFQN